MEGTRDLLEMSGLSRTLALLGFLSISACSSAGTVDTDSPAGQDKAEPGALAVVKATKVARITG